MAVTGEVLAERDEYFRQINRLASSSLLQGSESLCKLLRFLAEQTVDHAGSQVKEYQIATEVFGRPSHFDPRLDSTVRVQTGRLRSKLSEYYAGPGVEDPVIVEVPKGAYSLTFHSRTTSQVAGDTASSPVELGDHGGPSRIFATEPAQHQPKNRSVSIAFVGLSVGLVSALALSGYLVATRFPPPAPTVTKGEDLTAFRVFWRGFIEQEEHPLVVFSNAEFVGRPERGMRYFDPATDARDAILDHYTGVGEVLGIHELDRVFNLLAHGLQVKRGRLLSLDDVKNNDVIFIGSPSENLALREISTSLDFVFRRIDTPGRRGDLAILNVHPGKDEQRLYIGSAGIPVTEDYALIALAPGMNPTHQVMLLAGITTIGTQAAVEFVCRSASIEALMVRLSGSKLGPIKPFEAILKVRVSRGVPVESQIVAFRARSL